MKKTGLIFSIMCALVTGIISPSSSQDDPSDEKAPVYILPFKGEVELGLVQVFRRGFETAIRDGASHIIIETNTPGGRVDAALEIIDLILDTEIPVYIYVTGDATSAGAIISIAADGIYMKPGTTIGTAAPVMLGAAESETMNQKMLSLFHF